MNFNTVQNAKTTHPAGSENTAITHFEIKITEQARRRGASKGSNEPPLEVNNGGLKTQTVDFQLLANTGGMENKLRALQVLNYPARRR